MCHDRQKKKEFHIQSISVIVEKGSANNLSHLHRHTKTS